jgi:hypothetical protein
MFDDPVGAGVAAFPVPPSGLVAPIGPGFVVAIPVKDEDERLPACLRALAHQLDRSGQPIPPALVRVVLFANNCTDQSASLGRSLGELWSLDIRVFEAALPPGPRTLAPRVARPGTLPRLGSRKEVRGTA